MSRALNKSFKSDRRRGKRRGLGVAEWRQIRNATRGFQPITLTLKDEKGVKVPFSQVADTMASHYEKKQWEPPEEEYVPRANATSWPDLEDDEINGLILEEGVMAAAKQLKKNRSARPTGWPNEFIIVMLAAHAFRDLTVNLFNYFFNNESREGGGGLGRINAAYVTLVSLMCPW